MTRDTGHVTCSMMLQHDSLPGFLSGCCLAMVGVEGVGVAAAVSTGSEEGESSVSWARLLVSIVLPAGHLLGSHHLL